MHIYKSNKCSISDFSKPKKWQKNKNRQVSFLFKYYIYWTSKIKHHFYRDFTFLEHISFLFVYLYFVRPRFNKQHVRDK